MLVNTGPVLIVLLAGIFLGEGIPRGLLAGCAVAFGGCVLIGLSTSGSPRDGAGLGIALCLLAACAYATAVIVQKPVLARVPALQVTWIGCAAATVACLPFAPALVREAGGAGTGTMAWIVYLGAVPTALGFATWSLAFRRTSAGRMAALAYLIPVVAIVLGWVVLGERPARLAAAGGGMCLAGVALARR
jgi:drug/metabolite transporter (DMT)-like permease